MKYTTGLTSYKHWLQQVSEILKATVSILGFHKTLAIDLCPRNKEITGKIELLQPEANSC